MFILKLMVVFNLGYSYADSPIVEIEAHGVPIIEHQALSMYVDTEELSLFFSEAVFDDAKDEIRFITKSKIDKITVYKNGKKKVYVLPVKTNKIRLGLSMFEQGDYELQFEVVEKNEKISTFLEVF